MAKTLAQGRRPGSGRPPDPAKQFRTEQRVPISQEMFLPNLSGDHSAGRVRKTPTTDFEIANKKYVDDNAGGDPGGSDTQVQFNDGGTTFGGDAGLTYVKATDTLTVAGSLNVGTTTGDHILIQKGSSANLPFAFQGDEDTGITWGGSNSLSIVNGGIENVRIKNFGLGISLAGSKTAPSLHKVNDTNTGLFWQTGDRLNFTSGGIEFMRMVETTQNVLTFNEEAVDIDFRIESEVNPNAFFLQGNDGAVGMGAVPEANVGAGNLQLEGGSLVLKEITTPTADTNYGKIYTKTDNKLYFQDGAGVEHEIAVV